MNTAIPIISSLISIGLVLLGLRELTKELKVSYKRNLG
tara:strand:+ start:213 stop:326 length:114 start_codon:yes stop_codon:yes gene_type:complete